MKKILVLLVFLGGFIACNKENENPDLIGKWKLINVSGGFTGNGYDDASFIIMNFIDEKRFEFLDSLNNQVSEGKYYLHSSKDKNCIEFSTKLKLDLFYFDTELEYTLYNNDSLGMGPCFECNDCFGYLFVKK